MKPDLFDLSGLTGRQRTPFALARNGHQPARCEAVRNNGVNEVWLYGVITPWAWYEGEVSAGQFLEALKAFAGEAVTVRINSPGGFVTEGAAIYNALVAHDGEVTTQVDGLAASAAADVLMAGVKRRALGPAAFVMIHNAWGCCCGDQNDMLAYAEVLEAMDSMQRRIMTAVTGMSEDELIPMLEKDTWVDAETALEKGFLTEIGNAPEAASSDSEALAYARSFGLEGFEHVPAALKAPAAGPKPAKPPATQFPLAEDLERRLALSMADH